MRATFGVKKQMRSATTFCLLWPNGPANSRRMTRLSASGFRIQPPNALMRSISFALLPRGNQHRGGSTRNQNSRCTCVPLLHHFDLQEHSEAILTELGLPKWLRPDLPLWLFFYWWQSSPPQIVARYRTSFPTTWSESRPNLKIRKCIGPHLRIISISSEKFLKKRH